MSDTGVERLAILVHEVRSPVAALAAVREALADGALAPGDHRALVGLAVAACRGIDRLVSDIAVASIRLEKTDVVRLIEAAAASASLSGAVTVRSSSDTPMLQLDVDPQRLRQALDNLIGNAISVSAPGAEVVVRLITVEGGARISVVDTGPGIPADDLARIFEPGVRLDAGRPGSGLGLAIARAIAEAHGGTLTVESVPYAGATFTLALGTSHS